MTSYADKIENAINDYDLKEEKIAEISGSGKDGRILHENIKTYMTGNIYRPKRHQEQVSWTSIKYNKFEYNIVPPPISRQYAQLFF